MEGINASLPAEMVKESSKKMNKDHCNCGVQIQAVQQAAAEEHRHPLCKCGIGLGRHQYMQGLPTDVYQANKQNSEQNVNMQTRGVTICRMRQGGWVGCTS